MQECVFSSPTRPDADAPTRIVDTKHAQHRLLPLGLRVGCHDVIHFQLLEHCSSWDTRCMLDCWAWHFSACETEAKADSTQGKMRMGAGCTLL